MSLHVLQYVLYKTAVLFILKPRRQTGISKKQYLTINLPSSHRLQLSALGVNICRMWMTKPNLPLRYVISLSPQLLKGPEAPLQGQCHL